MFDFVTKQLIFLSFYSFSLTLIDALDTLLVSVSSIPFSLQEKYIPGQPKNVDMPRKGETYSSNSKSELERRESTEAVHSSQEMGA